MYTLHKIRGVYFIISNDPPEYDDFFIDLDDETVHERHYNFNENKDSYKKIIASTILLGNTPLINYSEISQLIKDIPGSIWKIEILENNNLLEKNKYGFIQILKIIK
jgi:hypothetical protein